MSHHCASGPSLHVTVERPAGGHRAAVRLRGDLDLATVGTLRHCLDSLVGDGALEVLLDLREVPFCDVPGLNLLLQAHGSLAAVAGRLTVLGPCPSLQVMLSTLGLDAALEVTHELEAGQYAAT
jgi:anti-anti-sigma factor